MLGIFLLRKPWFIKDVPSVQGGGIQLWAPRFTDSFLLGIINKFCVICFGNGKKCISQKWKPEFKTSYQTVDSRI